ncbi:family 18 glycosyltransferase [Melampsora larici-populina 98AG31]|uniref:alpha-1,6-mannosyl-glycoprotein 6-beta-N-acetylglucosaminyltransferase n=1 Tax=Melampsora larici-populina (strain 98AG31 / pathotype 3-4-7) TaxID=747676 RepID=F4RCT8_MELLP|nr:family 18 glycosyltransferase [Melampsora larici-populina 98AG31]EGG09779.1 family 18 glycosyltransferase [Melampsora larici-populina 98AG31]
MVVGDFLSASHCLQNGRVCAKSNSNPEGIPSHKIFVFDGFGQDIGHPLGRPWHLTFYPQEDLGFTYLGLTIEHYCHRFEVVPPSKRTDKIYVLGRDRGYFHPPTPQLFRPTIFTEVTNATGVKFTVGTVQPENEFETNSDIWPGLDDIGSSSRDEFMSELQHHRALLGIGRPVQPSTPLEALCVGTPFINPVWLGRRSIKDRSKWHSQHPYLARFDPPYVYNVQDHREEDVLEAVQAILKNPLTEPFIPDDMKKEAYLERIENLIRKDWEQVAHQTSKLE